MVNCFACYSLCNTQDQWMLHHSIQNETTAAQSTENPCSRTYQRVVLLLSGKQKPVSNPAEGKVFRPAWSTHPRVHVPTASVPTLSHQSMKKRRGKKNPKQPKKLTVYKIVEDKMFIAYYTTSSTSELHNTWCSFEPNWFCSFQGRNAKVMRLKDHRNCQ